MSCQVLLVSLDNGHKEFASRLKESFSKDHSVRVFNLRDVQTSRIYVGQATFAKKFASCVSDSNRIFLNHIGYNDKSG